MNFLYNKEGKDYNRILIDLLLIVLGALLVAVAINMFFLPNRISTGGASGIAIIIYYVYKVPVSLSVLLINIPLFIIALKKIGLKFCIRAIIGTLALIFFIQLTTSLKSTDMFAISNDLFLGSIFGGAILGSGLSLVFKADSSTGGSDLLANIIYKTRPVSSMSLILLVIDSFVILSNILAFRNLNTGLYSIVALFISKKTTEIIFEGINYTKVVNIITKKGEQIAGEIIEKTQRGVTISKCTGVYTNEEYVHVISVVTLPQLPKIKRIVKQFDEKAFVYISNTNEVLGIGFKDMNKIK